MLRFTRGSTIQFTATTFLDGDGAEVTPDTVTLYISYPTTGCAASAEVEMVAANDEWTASWESDVSEDGIVSWSIRAEADDTLAKDGQFQLTANDANPD